MKIHVLQVGYGDDESVTRRIDRVAALVAAQEGADLIVLPELWAAGGFAYPHWAERSEVLDLAHPGPVVAALSDAARAAGAVVHAGSLIERAAEGAERGETGRGLWNTSVLLDAQGRTVATYRKIHRFGFGQGEPSLLEAGVDLVTADLTMDGAPLTVGLATCYDLRFPEMFRGLLDAGAEMVLVSAAWPMTRVEAWRLLGRARAIENEFVMVQCNTAGTHSGARMGGYSQVVDATGAILAEAGPDDEAGPDGGVLVVDVDLMATSQWRQQFPVLADRRL